MHNATTLKRIGKGIFTTCYLLPCKKKVLLKSTDPVKECMGLGWFPNSNLFPKVAVVGKDYVMKYYPKKTSLKSSLKSKHWELYKVLRELMNHKTSTYHDLFNLFNTIPYKYNTAKQALLGALDACSNYGTDVCFEISPRNVAVSPTGGLILLDCFFMKSALVKTYYNP